MRSTKGQSRRIALCGLFGALAAVMMILGGIFPFSTFVAPAVAGILIVPIAVEYGLKTGFLLYIAISLMSFFMVPDKEMSLIFIFLLGYYPLLKALLERLRAKSVQWVAKLLVFNASILGMYSILLFLFPIDAIVQEFETSGPWLAGVLLLLGNATFVIYDIALTRVIGLYLYQFRPRIMHMH